MNNKELKCWNQAQLTGVLGWKSLTFTKIILQSTVPIIEVGISFVVFDQTIGWFMS